MRNRLLFILLLFFLTSTINSCSNNDDENENLSGETKPKRYKVVESDGDSWTLNFQYDGNLIKKITTDFGNTLTFNYENGKLKNYNVESPGEPTEIFTAQYENNLLKQLSNNTNSEKYIFEYNSDKQVIKSNYYENNNFAQTEYFEYDSNGNIKENRLGSTIFQSTFDNANNPFRNVFPQMDAETTYEWFGGLVNNETLSKVKYGSSSNFTTQYTYSYEYNSKNFPIKRIQKNPNGTIRETVIYEYY